MPREGACEEMKAIILRRPPTEVGPARLRQPKVSKSATAEFDGRPSRRMAASPCRASILRDAMLRTAPQDEVVDFFTRPVTGKSLASAECLPSDSAENAAARGIRAGRSRIKMSGATAFAVGSFGTSAWKAP